MLLRAFGAEDRDRNRTALRDIIAFDPSRHVVTQTDGFGALGEAAFCTLLNDGKAATAMSEKIRRAGSVRQQRRCPSHENQTGFMKAGGRSPRSDADDLAERPRDLGA